jgi:hypothetical protein
LREQHDDDCLEPIFNRAVEKIAAADHHFNALAADENDEDDVECGAMPHISRRHRLLVP